MPKLDIELLADSDGRDHRGCGGVHGLRAVRFREIDLLKYSSAFGRHEQHYLPLLAQGLGIARAVVPSVLVARYFVRRCSFWRIAVVAAGAKQAAEVFWWRTASSGIAAASTVAVTVGLPAHYILRRCSRLIDYLSASHTYTAVPPPWLPRRRFIVRRFSNRRSGHMRVPRSSSPHSLPAHCTSGVAATVEYCMRSAELLRQSP